MHLSANTYLAQLCTFLYCTKTPLSCNFSCNPRGTKIEIALAARTGGNKKILDRGNGKGGILGNPSGFEGGT